MCGFNVSITQHSLSCSTPQETFTNRTACCVWLNTLVSNWRYCSTSLTNSYSNYNKRTTTLVMLDIVNLSLPLWHSCCQLRGSLMTVRSAISITTDLCIMTHSKYSLTCTYLLINCVHSYDVMVKNNSVWVYAMALESY